MPKTTKKEPKGEAKAKGAKKPSAYNIFMKDELAKIKKAKPGIEHKCVPALCVAERLCIACRPPRTPPPCAGARGRAAGVRARARHSLA